MEKEIKVPNLQIDAKNRIIVETKKIPLMVNDKEIFVTIKKLNTGERNKIRAECTKVKMMGGVPQVSVNETEIQEKILFRAITDAPFETSIEDIKKLPSDITDYLFNEYNQFAEPTEKKNSESGKA